MTKKPKDDIHEITVGIPDSAIREMENAITIKTACGNFFGIEDEFIAHVVRAIREGKKSITLERKRT